MYPIFADSADKDYLTEMIEKYTKIKDKNPERMIESYEAVNIISRSFHGDVHNIIPWFDRQFKIDEFIDSLHSLK